MPAKNPRQLQTVATVPTLIVAVVDAGTATALSAAPGTGLEHVVKQLIIVNNATTTQVVQIYYCNSTTVTSVNKIIETSVAADSTTILYVNYRVAATYYLLGESTTTNLVAVTIIGDLEVA